MPAGTEAGQIAGAAAGRNCTRRSNSAARFECDFFRFQERTVRQLRHVRSLYRRRSDLHSLELGIVGK